MVLKHAWKVSWWCTRQTARLTLWSSWLGLIALLAAQGYFLASHHISIPEPIRRAIGDRLAQQGLHFKFSRGLMDFSGQLSLENVSIGPISATAPLATASSIFVSIDPWSLLIGDIDIDEVRVSGLDLYEPADQSPSGTNERLIRDIDFFATVNGNNINLSPLSGYIADVPVYIYGQISIPSAATETSFAWGNQGVSSLNQSWRKLTKQIQSVTPYFSAFTSPQLHVHLVPAQNESGLAQVDFSAATVDLGQLSANTAIRLTDIHAQAHLPLDRLFDSPLNIIGRIGSVRFREDVAAEGINFRIRCSPTAATRFSPASVDLQLTSARWCDIQTGSLTLTATRAVSGLIDAHLALSIADGPWQIDGQVNPETGTGFVQLDGRVSDSTLAFAGRQIQTDLSSLLDPAQSAPLTARASFGPNWQLNQATGRLHSGFVMVGGAPLDETGTEFTYDGTRVLCDNLVLRLTDSLAIGSYEMDTKTMDFRFLLTGKLRPLGISPWFHSWWTDFWHTFDFKEKLPLADVDVRGRWGDLSATRVFVQAHGADVGLQCVPFDQVSTRLFLRPHWFDILHFDVAQTNHRATGWLSRSFDLTKNTWKRMDFDVTSSLPLTTIEQLFKAESADLLAPYHFSTPPQMRLLGRVDSDAAETGKHERIDVTLTSNGPMTYHGFPLSDLTFRAQIDDDIIDLPSLSVGFADGKAQGQAKLTGPASARRLAFNINLTNANLGSVTQAIGQLQPKSAQPPAEPTAKQVEAARVRQDRLDRGQLDFSLNAEGSYADFLSFRGTGHAVITGAELGQLNLFGPLSEALSGTVIKLGSFSLNQVNAPFTLEGNRVSFDDLRVTGPSALLQLKGSYYLRDEALDFSANVYPFETNASVLGNAVNLVLTPLSRALEVKLKGTVDNPSWIFAYGPSRLINTLIGNEKSSSSTDRSPPPDSR